MGKDGLRMKVELEGGEFCVNCLEEFGRLGS